MTQISAIIPTRDRPDLLRDALLTLARQRVDPGVLEVVVVDDGSSRDLAGSLPPGMGPVAFRLERRDPVGLNLARNHGARAASGRILAFLDDDVLVSPSWAGALLDAFSGAGCDAVAGRIRLRLEGDEPIWLTRGLRSYLSELDLGDAEAWLDDMSPYGANCAVTREVFEAVGGFRAGLDRQGGSLISSGDVEFFERVRGRGGRILYAPAAAVDHRVPAERLTATWFRRRAFAQGVTDAMLEGAGPTASKLAREVVRLSRTLPILVKNAVVGHGSVPAGIWAAYCRGRLARLRGSGA